MASNWPGSVDTAPSPTAGHGIPYTDVSTAWDAIVAMQTAMLAETAVTYASGNFSPTGGGTWTFPASASNQIVFSYNKNGKFLRMDVILDATTIAGTVSAISVAIPGGFLAARQCWGHGVIFDNSSTVASLAKVRALAANASVITLGLASGANLSASTALTYVRFTIVIPTTT